MTNYLNLDLILSANYLFWFHRYAFPIKCTNVIYEKDTENVIEIHAEYDPERKAKPKVWIWQADNCLDKDMSSYYCDWELLRDQAPFFEMQGVLHWVSQPSSGVEPLKVEVRLFEKLFLSQVSKAAT